MSGRDRYPPPDEPEGVFRDAVSRPVYRLRFRAEPRVDEVRALRALLKVALRRFGLQCLSIERDRDRDSKPQIR